MAPRSNPGIAATRRRERGRDAVVLSGGWMHPVDQAGAALAEILDDCGYETEIISDPTAVTPAALDGADLVAINSCWFSMSDDRYTADQRSEFAVGRDSTRESALLRTVARGAPMLAMHTAVICFDGWDDWEHLLGGAWDWGRSSHPPPEQIEVVPTSSFPAFAESFTVTDELYQDLRVADDVTLVATSTGGDPLVWLNETTSTRVAVDLLGHDRRSLDHGTHRSLVAAMIDWLDPSEPNQS